jgi:beta-lactamase regulating signal transducer with metallopeptidase domain
MIAWLLLVAPFVGGYLWQGLVQGSLLTLLVWLATRTILRQAPPRLHAVLWTIALLKFLVPVKLGLPYTVGGLVDPGWRSGESLLFKAEEVVAATGLAQGRLPDLFGLLVASYLVGVLFLAARRALAFGHLLRRIRSLPLAPEVLTLMVAEAASRVGVRAPVARTCLVEGSPFVVGLLRPVLVAPRWESFSPEALDAMLLHELAHLKRRDPWARGLLVVAEVAFFFWPLVRVAGRALTLAQELACDASAVQQGTLDARAYARCLLELYRRFHLQPVDGLAVTPQPSFLERRIDMALTSKAIGPSWRFLTVAVLALAAAAFVLVTAPRADERKPTKEGTLPREVISSTIKSNIGQIRLCYETALLVHPQLAGTVVARWTIGSDGITSAVGIDRAQMTIPDADFERCLLDKIRAWRFPPPSGGEVKVTYPFTLRAYAE